MWTIEIKLRFRLRLFTFDRFPRIFGRRSRCVTLLAKAMDVKPAARRDEAFERLLPDPEEIEEALGYSADRDISAAIVTTPTDDLKAYCCLFVMGAAILIPFNSVINSIEYLRSRLIGQSFEQAARRVPASF